MKLEHYLKGLKQRSNIGSLDIVEFTLAKKSTILSVKILKFAVWNTIF
jgi:hypothetical protein